MCVYLRPGHEGVKELAEQTGVEGADELLGELGPVDQVGAVGHIYNGAGQAVIHGDDGVAEAVPARMGGVYFRYGLAENQPDVLDTVVCVNFQVALYGNLQVPVSVAGESVEHVVQERDAGVDGCIVCRVPPTEG